MSSHLSYKFTAHQSNTDISDFSFSSADAKAIIKNHILMSQKMGNSCEGQAGVNLILICMKFI